MRIGFSDERWDWISEAKGDIELPLGEKAPSLYGGGATSAWLSGEMPAFESMPEAM